MKTTATPETTFRPILRALPKAAAADNTSGEPIPAPAPVPTSWALSQTRYEHPAAVEFADAIASLLADDTILVRNVEAGNAGVVDVVLAGRDATIGICFDTRAVERPVPYFVDHLFVISPLDVLDFEAELFYVLLKSAPTLFSERSRNELPRAARVDHFNFAKPRSGRLSAYEVRSASRRHAPLVLRVMSPEADNSVQSTPAPAAA